MNRDFPVDPDSIIEFAPPKEAKAESLIPAFAEPILPPPCCPKAAADGPNEKYAAILRSVFCGRDSELSLALCYLYQSMRFGCCGDELCASLYNFALHRFKAVKLLGDLICSLGSDPKFFCGHVGNSPAGSWWNASPTVLRYPQHLGDAIKSAINREQILSQEYKNLLNYLDDDGICRALKEIKSEKDEDITALTLLHSRFCS
ncbi:MAG: manganese catalase family protein [Oscillospiraceae bacterium]|nr:manganese catalase family protein [Oscillospiraceae bacterium]MBQ4538173.1 manganese catalase family protein [Oscillospiraceae bacterium]